MTTEPADDRDIPPLIRRTAHAVPLVVLPSCLWRLALGFGIPVGFTGELAAQFAAPGRITGYVIVLCLISEALALLTLGLIKPWGEVVPGWVPYLRGRRLPTTAVVFTAALGSLAVTAICVVSAFEWNSPQNNGDPDAPHGLAGVIMAACYAPLLAWGPLLAIVTVHYYRRRHREDRRARHTRPTAWSRWPDWVGYATAVWSGAYGLLGLSWALGGRGFPFGVEHDPNAGSSLLEHAEATPTGAVIAVVGLLGSAAAVVMSRRRVRPGRGPLCAFAWILAAGLAIAIPDYRPLLAVVRGVMLLVGAPFGFPEHISLTEFLPLFLPWPVANQIVLILGGLLWAATAIAYRRRTDDACLRCGRSPAGRSRWTTPESAAQWGRWATAVAIAVPVFYAATRMAWKLGIPLGLSPEGLDSLRAEGDGIFWAGAMLATMALGGAVLTLGLVQKWGEVYPRWVPRLRGRPVRQRTAIIPASLVAILITQAGLMNLRRLVNGHVNIGWDTWGLHLPGKLFALWGIALGGAVLAYHLRRRGQCGTCGLA